MGVERRFDTLGRVVIPSEFRKRLDINNNTLVDIERDGDKIIIRKVDECCACCGRESYQLKKVCDISLCPKCLKIFNKARKRIGYNNG